MTGVGTAATMAMLLLAMVVAAATAMSPPDAVDHHRTAAAHRHGGRNDYELDDGVQSPMEKLTRCAGICGSDVASCMVVECFEPLASGKGNPVMTPVCLFGCTTAALSCGTRCPNDILN